MDLYRIRNLFQQGANIYEIPMKVTYYARVSTDKYEQANSLKNQIDYFSEFIKKNQAWEYVEGYIDEGLSGTSVNKRDSFLRMVADAREGRFDFIITKEISRFSRNTLDSIRYTQMLLSYGVGVFFQTDNINTLMPDAELRLTIMSSIAQEEVRKLSERVKFGMKRSIEKGRVLGNSNLWGYRKENGRLVVEKQEAEIVRLIFDWYANGKMGTRAIARRLSGMGYKSSAGTDFCATTVRNIVTNPKYKGYYCGNKTKVVDYRMKNKVFLSPAEWVVFKDEETVPPIVSETLWESANALYQKKRERAKETVKTSTSSRYAYSGKIFCALHGEAFHRTVYRYSTGNREAWQCAVYRKGGKAACAMPTVYTEELNAVADTLFLKPFLGRCDIVKALCRRYEAVLDGGKKGEGKGEAAKEMVKLESQREKLLDLYLEGKIPKESYLSRNASLGEKISLLEKEHRRMKTPYSKMEDMKNALEGLLQGEKRELLLGELTERITVLEGSDKKRLLLEAAFIDGQTERVEYDRREKSVKHHFVCDNTYD